MTFLTDTTIYMTVTSLFILIFKKVFKNKLSAKWQVFIWALLIVRFLVPELPQSEFSVFNKVNIPKYQIYQSDIIENETDTSVVHNDENTQSYVQMPLRKNINFEDLIEAMWLFGAFGLFLYFVLVYWLCVYKSNKNKKIEDDETVSLLYECKQKLNIKRKIMLLHGEKSPMLMGIFRPKIIIPDGFTLNEKKDILIHELCHLKNNDIVVIWAGMLVLCLNWFNPVIWYSFFTLRRDIEVYCDERVLKYSENKKEYASLLLKTALSKNKFIMGTTSLQNGEKEVTRRIKYMAYFKKPKVIWSMIIALVAIVISAVCLTNSQKDYSFTNEKYSQFCNRIVGSIMAELDYADSEKVVFHYFDGLFVYDYNKEEIIREFDLSKLNCASHQQGSNGINIIVSSDGKKALIANYGPADEIEDFENYIINLENGKVKETTVEKLENPFMKIKDIVSTVKNVKGWGSNLCVESENGIFYLTCRTERIGDMELVKIVDSEEKNFYVFSGKFSNFDIIINETLRDGEAIVTNSGMGWYFNIDKEMFKEIEKLSSYLGFDASKLLNNKKFFGKNLYCCIYDITKEKALYNYLFVFDNDNGELLFYTTIQPKELEKISKLLINIEKLSSSQIKTALYVIAEKYMEEEYRRVHSPYYDLQELIISDWKENGNEAEFFYKMTFLYYNRDPDKAQYIQEAKKINQEKYETLYEDYLALKETNAHFKIVLDGQKISLYYDVGPKGVEWSPIEIDDFVKGGENKKAGTVAGLGKGAFKTAKNLSQRDISYIENTLNSFKWQNSTADCLNDFVISIEGKEYYYHSDCGTINDNKNNRSLNLSDEYKQELNIILFNYADNKPTKENFLYQLNVKNVTPTGLTLVFNVFGGTTATDITASGWYNIEKKNGKEWESITTEKEKVYNDMAYIIYKGKETEIELDWSYLYGKLENGKYRIVKELQWFYPSKKFEKSLVYAEFEI